MENRYVAYEESTPWPAWVAALAWGSFLVPAVLVLRRALEVAPVDGAAALGRFVLAAALALVPILVWLLLGRLRVQVSRASLDIGFGQVSWIRKRVPLAEVVGMESVRYSPLRDFGGWGIRGGSGGKMAWTMRGDRALRLTLRDGKLLYVGSEDPDRLAQRIRVAAGGRVGPGAGAA